MGKLVTVITRSDLVDFYLANMTDTDVIIMVSYSGETTNLTRFTKSIHAQKIPLIVLTSYGTNTLSEQADVVLTISTHEKLIENYGNFSTNLSISYLFDCLYAGYFSKVYETNYQQKIQLEKQYQQFRFSDNPLIE